MRDTRDGGVGSAITSQPADYFDTVHPQVATTKTLKNYNCNQWPYKPIHVMMWFGVAFP